VQQQLPALTASQGNAQLLLLLLLPLLLVLSLRVLTLLQLWLQAAEQHSRRRHRQLHH
jgi:hypothetical protein